MKMNFTSIGYSIKCKCGELAKWQVIDNNLVVIYLCERCFIKEEELRCVKEPIPKKN